MNSNIILIFIFLFISCGVKKDPSYPSGDKEIFIKSFMNKVEPTQQAQKDKKKKKNKVNKE